VCLLVVLHGVVPGMPLVVAANRDERRDRPTVPMMRLTGGSGGPVILGGRDEVGGGTWLATNEHGVVAGLTNRPMRDGPDTSKRSRGEVPLALALHSSAALAVAAFGDEIVPSDFNPSWLLVADRTDLFFVDVTGTERVAVEPLPRGVHVLENRDLHETSPKATRVRALVEPLLSRQPDHLLDGLAALLANHENAGDPPGDTNNPRLAHAAQAICVHADEDDYGTRSSAIIAVPDERAVPDIRWTADAPCHARWRTADELWPPP
jgi:uncharacterized protein with NRDE domain